MVKRTSLVSLTAVFVALSALVGLLPLIGELAFGPVIGTFAAPSPAQRVLTNLRDLLLFGALVLAYLVWLRRQTPRYVLDGIVLAIGTVTLLLHFCSWNFPNPIYHAVAVALNEAVPWFLFAALLYHSSLADAFDPPIPIRLSVRCLLIVLVVHIALFITVEAVPILPDAVRDALNTFLLLPAKILLGVFIQFGAGRIVLDSPVWSTAGPVLMIPVSALAWGCLIGLVWPRLRDGRASPH